MSSLFAELERDIVSERIKAGGKKLGKPENTKPHFPTRVFTFFPTGTLRVHIIGFERMSPLYMVITVLQSAVASQMEYISAALGETALV